MKSLPPLSLTADETRAVANAIRALGRHLESDHSDPEWERIEKLLRVWDRPEIQEVLRAVTSAEELKMLGLVLRFRRLNDQTGARERQKRSAQSRSEKLAERDRLIRALYAEKKNRDRSYSVAQFRRDLGNRVISMSRKLRASLRPNGRVITEERLRSIVKNA
jgi:hypothetical protein